MSSSYNNLNEFVPPIKGNPQNIREETLYKLSISLYIAELIN